MNLSLAVVLVIGVALSGVVVSIELYSSRYDSIDIDGILSSDRLVTNYVECLLNTRPCPPEGKALKRVLPEALKSKCQRCSTKQKESALKVIRRLHDKYPDKWLELAERYDPTGDYRRSYDEYLRTEQFNSIDGIGGSPNDRPQIPEKEIKPVLPEIGVRFNFDEQQSGGSGDQQPANSNAGDSANKGPTEDNEQKPAPPVRSVPAGGTNNVDTTTITNNIPTTAIPVTERPTVKTNVYLPPVIIQNSRPINRFSTGRPSIYTHMQEGFQSNPISSHVLGIVTNLGNKVARTAELFAGMLKNTVHVIVG